MLAIIILLFSWNLIACSKNIEDIELTNVDVVSMEEVDTASFKQDIIEQDTTNIENKKANINDIEEIDKETEEVNKEVNKEVDKKVNKEVNKEVEEYIEEFVVTEFETQRVMYAKSTVNVRTGPSTDYERKGVLQQAEEIIVLGQADTGWRQIASKDKK